MEWRRRFRVALVFGMMTLAFAQSTGAQAVLAVFESYDPATESQECHELQALVVGDGEVLAPPTSVVQDPTRLLGSVDLLALSDGGAFLCWQGLDLEEYTGDLFLQRLDSQGKCLWTNPLPLTEGPDDDGEARLASDAQGGALLAWTRTDENFEAVASLQRINSQGELLWEMELPRTPGTDSAACGVVPDGKGGAFLLATLANPESPSTCVVQHVDDQGHVLWATPRLLFNTGKAEGLDAVFPDGAGGILAVGSFMAFADGSLSSCEVIVQHMDSQGNGRWGDVAPRITDTLGCAYQPAALPDLQGGLYLAYVVSDPTMPASADHLPDTDVMVQHLDARGQAQWVAEPMLLFGGEQMEMRPAIFAAGNGKCLVLAQMRDRTGAQEYHMLAEGLSVQGQALWNGVMPEQRIFANLQLADGQWQCLARGQQVDVLTILQEEGGGRLAWTHVGTQAPAALRTLSPLLPGPMAQRGVKAVVMAVVRAQ